MVSYKIFYRSSVKKDFKPIPKEENQKILEKIAALAKNPRPENCLKMAGRDQTYRLRVGDYRVVYQIDDSEKLVMVEKIAHRKDVYR